MQVSSSPARTETKMPRLRSVNHEPGPAIYRNLAPFFSFGMRALIRRDWELKGSLPQSGPLIVVPNHLSSFDPGVIGVFMCYSGRWPYFLYKSTLMKVPVFSSILRAAEMVPVYRGTERAADSLRDAVKHLEKGRTIVMYPEGTTTWDPDEWPMAAKTGAARLALLSGAPVVPIGHLGANDVYGDNLVREHTKRGGFHLLPPRKWTTVRVGEQIDLSAFGRDADDREMVRGASAAIMDGITALVEQLRGEKAPELRYNPKVEKRVPRSEAVW
jgi:1-acyl-sn-glycerol-3-phosphate acyltransferase